MDALDQIALEALRVQALHTIAEVAGETGPDGCLRVLTSRGGLPVRRALSCLIRPEPGDRVLVSGTLPDQLWLLAVLERPGEAPLRLTLDRPAELAVSAGDLRLRAPGGLHLEGGERLEAGAPEVVLRGDQATFAFRRLTALAREALASLRTCRLLAGWLDTSAERVHLRAETARREVRGLDQTRAGNLELQADQTLRMQGEHLLASADKLVRVDGDQIHLG
jgi:hypothetical protein